MPVVLFVIVIYVIAIFVYAKLEKEVLEELDFSDWNVVPDINDTVNVKSRQTLNNYDLIKYFKEESIRFERAKMQINRNEEVLDKLRNFLDNNSYTNHILYFKIKKHINALIDKASYYKICVNYYSSAGNHLGQKFLLANMQTIKMFEQDPSLLMGKGEYNKYLKEQQKNEIEKRQHEFYDKVNNVIDIANQNREKIIKKENAEKIDDLIAQLFDRTVNSIAKIKSVESGEWQMIGDFISSTENQVNEIVQNNKMILDYYESEDFNKIKMTCDSLMNSQKEFNEYINEKVQSITKLFGTRVVRNETNQQSEYNYVRPYKKTISPFTAEVSAAVFASAENNPLTYVVKNFYPNKFQYPEQIQKLQTLIEELETLKDAKKIIDNYKKDYEQYIINVPSYVMENDETGFYARLGFAYIDEDTLTIDYKFAYTSGGGLVQRTFTIPMTEENIVELISILQEKLTESAFKKEQRALMTKKLRDSIKERDNFTCCSCGNSVMNEPNLLLEIDHIIPIAKGGITEESNLQTLCWKCNRSKSDKILN